MENRQPNSGNNQSKLDRFAKRDESGQTGSSNGIGWHRGNESRRGNTSSWTRLATEKQLALLRRLNIEHSGHITRAEASEKISRVIGRR